MSTCKDCLHYDLCKEFTDYTEEFIASCEKNFEKYGDAKEKCEYFKDKSKSVDLPCKVGEDLYRLKTINGKTIITTTQLNQNTLWRIVFGGEYGKSVFLTKEEAEKALKNNNG